MNGALHLSVTDDGDGPGTSPHQGTGTSLTEMSERLQLIYGEAARLEAGRRDSDGGYRVEVVLPMELPT